MANCVGCKSQPVSTNCIVLEEELPLEYKDFNDLLHQLSKATQDLSSLMKAEVDKKWIKDNKVYILDYIQEIINEIDLIKKNAEVTEEKYVLNSSLVKGENSALQLFNIIFKELEAMKKQSNNNFSSLYLP